MKFLIDMNLSPRWCGVLQPERWDSVHWSQVGIASAPDHEIMQWALGQQRIVLTHDRTTWPTARCWLRPGQPDRASCRFERKMSVLKR